MHNNIQKQFLYSYNRNKQIVKNNNNVKFDVVYGNEINVNSNINNFIIKENGLYKINYCVYVSSIFPVFLGLYKNEKLIPGSKYGNTLDNIFLVNIKKLINNLCILLELNNDYLANKLISENPNSEINNFIEYLKMILNNKFDNDVNHLINDFDKMRKTIDNLDDPAIFNLYSNNNDVKSLYNIYNTIIELIKNNIDDIFNQILNNPIVKICGTTFVELNCNDIVNLKNLSNYTIRIPLIDSLENPNAINAYIDIEKKCDSVNISQNYYINNQNKNNDIYNMENKTP